MFVHIANCFKVYCKMLKKFKAEIAQILLTSIYVFKYILKYFFYCEIKIKKTRSLELRMKNKFCIRNSLVLCQDQISRSREDMKSRVYSRFGFQVKDSMPNYNFGH